MGLDATTLRAAAAIYGTGGDESEWATTVAEALRPAFDADLGMVAYRYRVDARGMTLELAHGVDLPHGLSASELAIATMSQPVEVSAALYAKVEVSAASDLGAACLYHVQENAADYGVHDLHGIHASLADGGWVFAILAPRVLPLSPTLRSELELIRAHVVAGIAQRKRDARRAGATLSAREREVLEKLAHGFTRKEIGYALGIAAPTVRVLLHRAARKLGVDDRDELLHRSRELFP